MLHYIRMTRILPIAACNPRPQVDIVEVAGTDPEILHGGCLSGWLPIRYYIKLWGGGASHLIYPPLLNQDLNYWTNMFVRPWLVDAQAI